MITEDELAKVQRGHRSPIGWKDNTHKGYRLEFQGLMMKRKPGNPDRCLWQPYDVDAVKGSDGQEIKLAVPVSVYLLVTYCQITLIDSWAYADILAPHGPGEKISFHHLEGSPDRIKSNIRRLTRGLALIKKQVQGKPGRPERTGKYSTRAQLLHDIETKIAEILDKTPQISRPSEVKQSMVARRLGYTDGRHLRRLLGKGTKWKEHCKSVFARLKPDIN